MKWAEDPARRNPDRCQVLVDGEPCGYFSVWDELMSNPELNSVRSHRHAWHLANASEVERLIKKAGESLRGTAQR